LLKKREGKGTGQQKKRHDAGKEFFREQHEIEDW